MCVKGISFSNPLMAPRIVEWIELLLILGAEKIFMHHYHIADEIMKVLQYYQDQGLLNLKQLTWGGYYSK